MSDSSDLCDELFAEAGGFACADAVDAAELVHGARLDAGEFAQRRVVEDDVRRDVALAREAQAHGAQAIEQILVGVAGLGRGPAAIAARTLVDTTLPREGEAGERRRILQQRHAV